MPKIKVLLEDGRSEEHILDRNEDPRYYVERLKQLELPVSSFEVINPYVHNHQWQGTCGSGYFQRCAICCITGTRSGNTKLVTRDKKYASESHYYCQEPLKKLPKFKVEHGIFMPKLKRNE